MNPDTDLPRAGTAHRRSRDTGRWQAWYRLIAFCCAGLIGLGLADAAETAHAVNVRFGRHNDRVRIVIDLTASVAFEVIRAEDGRQLAIALPETVWDTTRRRSITKLAPLTGYVFRPSEGQTAARLELTTDGPVTVVDARPLTPDRGNKYHRIVVDLTAAPERTKAAGETPAEATPLPLSPVSGGALVAGQDLPLPGAKPPAPSGPGAALPLALAESAAASARSGDIAAQLEMGARILDPKSGSHDMAEALKWFRKAADNGSAIGAYNVGQFYRNGLGVKQDDALAAFWYGEAARSGFAPAQLNLGIMELRGIGVEPDATKGLELIQNAAAQGHLQAKQLLDRIRAYGPEDAFKSSRGAR
ncbi:MAG: hypothetical protein GC191_05985 [Azospirillum sp.]|nr:hypothetical protein [Azospirillum sp.]